MTDLMPLDTFLDRAHPANDRYMQSVDHIQRMIMHQTSLLRPKQVAIVKAAFAGHSTAANAQQNHTTAATVRRTLQSPPATELLRLLHYHQQMLDGPNLMQRRSMLWRIALDNEKTDPKVSILAIKELNQTQFKEQDLQAERTGHLPQRVEIVINPEHLPRTSLDQE